MTSPSDKPLHIPTLEELRCCVVPRCTSADADESSKGGKRDPARDEPDSTASPVLSTEAEAFLRHVVVLTHPKFTLEDHWAALGVTSSSKKQHVLKELRRHGLIRLERKGRQKVVHLYVKAYELLGISAPKGEGVGGTTHRQVVNRLAVILRKRKYEVHIEEEIGPDRKRVDILALGKQRIGVEVGLSSMNQELKNLRDDLASGVLDMILFVSTDRAMVDKVRSHAARDVVLKPQMHRLRFCYFDEETKP